MATKRCTSLSVDDVLPQRARKALHVTTNREAVIRALEEVVNNAEVETALRTLIRKGRGRFVDVYEEAQ